MKEAIQTGTHSPWVSRLFAARGHRVLVANAQAARHLAEPDQAAGNDPDRPRLT